MTARRITLLVCVASIAVLLLVGLIFPRIAGTSTAANLTLGAVVGGGIVLTILLCVGVHFWVSRKPEPHDTRPARIVEASSDNTMVLNQYVIRLVVEFDGPGGERRRAQVEQAVDMIDMAGYARGREVLLHRGSRGGKEVAWVSQPDPRIDEGAAS
ncbi:hypothetical protein GmRootV35_02470 [Variovorax sp. V35]